MALTPLYLVSSPSFNSYSYPRNRRRIAQGSDFEESELDMAKSIIFAPSKSRELVRNQVKWKTEMEKQIYSSKLASALRRLRRTEPEIVRSCAVRIAADRVLAVSAGGQMQWSRSILSHRRRSAIINKTHKRTCRTSIHRMLAAQMRRESSPLQRKIIALRRLVPGCSKISLSSLLSETTDYIAALEMQVKAMKFLTAVLNGGA